MFDKALKSIKQGLSELSTGIQTGLSSINKQKFHINNREYTSEKLIAEGGYGYVYEVTDSHNNHYALKKMNIISNNNLILIKNELTNWKKVQCPYIVKLLDYQITKDSVYILMELCTEGSLLDHINNTPKINENEALTILSHICQGLYKMHSQSPPISHRDIKVENVLKFGAIYKLCDFGSSSTDVLIPANENKNSIIDKFSVFERTTTFMYRPPEMVDEYSNYIVNEKVDIWAVGCILYCMLFKIHPFLDAQKLTIRMAHYYFPKESMGYSDKIIDFIRLLLTPNPQNRPSVSEVLDYIKNWKGIDRIKLPKEVEEIKIKQLKNIKENKGFKEVSEDELMKARREIEKDLKKKNKYKRKKDEDINDLFDDGDEYYKSKNMGMNKNNNNDNNKNNNAGQLFDFDSMNNNNNVQKSQNNNNFNNGFNFDNMNNNQNNFNNMNMNNNFGFNNGNNMNSNNYNNNMGNNFNMNNNYNMNNNFNNMNNNSMNNNFNFGFNFDQNANSNNQNNFNFDFNSNFNNNNNNNNFNFPNQQSMGNQGYQQLDNNNNNNQSQNSNNNESGGNGQNILDFFQ